MHYMFINIFTTPIQYSDMDIFLNGLGKAKTISKIFKLFCDDEIN